MALENSVQKAIGSALKMGFSGAVLFPIFYECTTNIGETFVNLLMLALGVCSALKLRGFKASVALTSATINTTFSCVFGVLLALALHKPFVSFFNSISDYRGQTYLESLEFLGRFALTTLIPFAFLLVRGGFNVASRKLGKNSTDVKSAIDNAFEDGDEK